MSASPTSPWPGTTGAGRQPSSSLRTLAQCAPSRSASFGGNQGKIGKMRSSARSPVKRIRSAGQPPDRVATRMREPEGVQFDGASAEVDRRAFTVIDVIRHDQVGTVERGG